MGVLAPGSAHARPPIDVSGNFPADMSADQSHLQASPPTPDKACTNLLMPERLGQGLFGDSKWNLVKVSVDNTNTSLGPNK
jgi:hypothetical protein